MPAVPLTSVDHSYLIDTNGEYVVADTTTPNGPLVTDRPSPDQQRPPRRHPRGGTGPLVTDRPSLIVQPLPTGRVTLTTAFLTESGNRLLTESGSFLWRTVSSVRMTPRAASSSSTSR